MIKSILLAILVFYPFAGAFLCLLAGKRVPGRKEITAEKNGLVRDLLADFVTVSEFLLVLVLAAATAGTANNAPVFCGIPKVCGFGLNFTLDGFRILYGLAASLMWMMTTIFSREYMQRHENKNRYYLFLLLTLGATMGVFLSADLYTTFIFFEIMSFTSYVWVAQEEDKASLRAAETYLGVAVLGGLVMLMGIFLIYHELGTVGIGELRAASEAYRQRAGTDPVHNQNVLYAAGACMLFGFGAKAGAFPLHIWLPKAHPVAPAPASALLSGILTKTGIYGVLILSANLFLHDALWGKIVLGIGVLTMFGGAVLAVFSINLKRTLACSSMSQIGFILVGIGMQGMLGEENALAVHGTLLHMMNHSMIKLVLFMAAGVIFMNTHELDLNEIRGFGRKKPLLKAIFLTGALAIGGIPLFGGYVSKTLLHESIAEYGGDWLMKAVEYIFLFSGGLTVAYMTKLYVAVFVEENESKNVQRTFDKMKTYMNRESTFALTASGLILLIWGLFPHSIMDRAANLGQAFLNLEEAGGEAAYFSLGNLSGAAVSIIIGALVYLLVIRKLLMTQTQKSGSVYVDRWPGWLDLENLIYRPLLLGFLPFVLRVLCRILDSFADLSVVVLRKSIYRDSPLPHELPEGNRLTMIGGKIVNFFASIANHTWRRSNPIKKDYVHAFAVKRTEWKENNMIIGRSLSFGLLLFCIGLCLTLVYLIWL